MKAERLRDAIWKIDDKFIKEAETYVPKKRSGNTIWIITSASAAVIALCTCIHFHNATEHALRPEIDNSVAVVTTAETAPQTDEAFTEAPVFNGQSTDTVRSIFSDDTVYTEKESTETTVTEEGYESSVPDAATVPEKTEAPSGNGGSSGEKSVPDKHPQEVTEVSSAEITDTEQTSSDQTLNPVTEPTIYPLADSTKGTPVYVETVPSSTWYPSPIPTPSPCGNPTLIPTPSPHSDPTSSNLPLPSATVFPPVSWEPVSPEYIDKTSDFPAVLKTADGVRYERRLLITKRQAGKFVQTISLSDDKGNDYELSEFSLRYDVSEYSSLNGVSEDQVSVFYFEREDEYLIYVKEP